MREILFRGKREDNGKWAEGSAVWFDEDQCFIMPPYPLASTLSYARLFALTAVMVDPTTIGQYTGLTDKNGVKIFEGDVLRRAYYPNDDVVIEWNDGSFHFRKRVYPKEYGYESICCNQVSVTRLKIIGNIHDNPELLKGGAGSD